MHMTGRHSFLTLNNKCQLYQHKFCYSMRPSIEWNVFQTALESFKSIDLQEMLILCIQENTKRKRDTVGRASMADRQLCLK